MDCKRVGIPTTTARVQVVAENYRVGMIFTEYINDISAESTADYGAVDVMDIAGVGECIAGDGKITSAADYSQRTFSFYRAET